MHHVKETAPIGEVRIIDGVAFTHTAHPPHIAASSGIASFWQAGARASNITMNWTNVNFIELSKHPRPYVVDGSGRATFDEAARAAVANQRMRYERAKEFIARYEGAQ